MAPTIILNNPVFQILAAETCSFLGYYNKVLCVCGPFALLLRIILTFWRRNYFFFLILAHN